MLCQVSLVLGIPKAAAAMPRKVLSLEAHVPGEGRGVAAAESGRGIGPQVPFAAVAASITRRLQPPGEELGPVGELVHRRAQVVHVGADAVRVRI